MGRSKSKVIVYLIISAVVIILIKLWLHYTSWLPIATIRAEEQTRAVCKEYVLTCESVEINELIRGEPYARTSSACPRQKNINFIKVL